MVKDYFFQDEFLSITLTTWCYRYMTSQKLVIMLAFKTHDLQGHVLASL